MNREILFRGKIKYNGNHLFAGEWVEGSLIVKTKGVFIYVIEKDEFDNVVRELEVEVIPETVGQFTGLLDKNGVRFFEGDIVVVYDGSAIEPYFNSFLSSKHTGVLIFNGNCFSLKCGNVFVDQWINAEYIEKLGNIHDNPNLLTNAN